jgi:hypothetical protein
MARPFTRAQALENRAFLKALRRTGNVRLAAREVGVKYGTIQHRRKQHPGFAVKWDAALAFFQAWAEREKEGRHGSESHDVRRVALRAHAGRPAPSLRAASATRSASAALHSAVRHRTSGGEPVIVRLASGALQVRRAQPGKLTREAEQAFLAALSATANVKLSAAAAGACEAAFYRRRRQNPAFAREMRLALQMGYDRLEAALLESGLAGSHEHDDWRSNEPPAIPPMTPAQALQLMYLHQKEARLTAEPWRVKRRRGESSEAYSERLALMAEERQRRAREAFELAEAERWSRGQPAWGPAGEDVRAKLGLPDLSQVTGWSRADPKKVPHDPDRALFGGWRIEEMERELERREWGWSEAEEEGRARPRVRRL